MTLFQLYFYFVVLPWLDSVGLFLSLVSPWVALMFIVTILMHIAEEDSIKASVLHFGLKVSLFAFLFGGLLTMAPSKQEVLLLTGAYAVTNNQALAELPTNILDAANSYLEEIQKKGK